MNIVVQSNHQEKIVPQSQTWSRISRDQIKTVCGFSPTEKTWPKGGWFNSCSTCQNPTSRYVVVNQSDKFYCCKRCQKKQTYRRYKICYATFDVELF